MNDLISRQAVLKIIDGWYENNRDTENIEDLIILITYMSSVNPQEPKTGHWTHPKVVYMPYEYADSCSCCKEWGKILTFKANFCPNCGARMVEPQESEDEG